MIKVTFIGHASLCIESEGTKLVTDPHLRRRMLWSPKYRAPGLKMSQIRDADAVLLSHGHFDHMDLRSIREFSESAQVIAPPKIGWMGAPFINGRRHTLKRWEELEIDGAKITAVPVNHANFRPATLFGQGSGYIIEMGGMTLFFAGDTAYFRGFEEIGVRYDIDVAFLPIGPIKPWFIQRFFHLDPDQAIKAFMKLNARKMAPIHWGAFSHIFEDGRLAVTRLKALAEQYGLEDMIKIIEPGQSVCFEPADNR